MSHIVHIFNMRRKYFYRFLLFVIFSFLKDFYESLVLILKIYSFPAISDVQIILYDPAIIDRLFLSARRSLALNRVYRVTDAVETGRTAAGLDREALRNEVNC